MSALLTSAGSKRILRLSLPLAALVAVAVALIVPGLGSARAQSPPQNTKEPSISGSTAVGDTLTGTTGEWTGNPTTFKFDWRRCPPDGGQGAGNCDGIVDGPSKTYTLQPQDVNFTIRLLVKAWNGDGKGVATSNATGQITGQGVGPTNTGLPTVTGTADVGQTLTGSKGTWENDFLADYSYAWLRCDASGNNCQTIAGAPATTYVVAGSDRGSTLRMQVSATDPAGTTQVASAQTAVVPGGKPVTSPPPPLPPTSAGCPGGRRAVQASAVTSPARLLIDRQIATTLHLGAGQQVVVRYRVSDTCGQVVQGALVYATAVPFGQLSTSAEAPTGPNGFVDLTFQTLAGFPLGPKQRSVQIFVRARKLGEDMLAGISARRLFEIPITR